VRDHSGQCPVQYLKNTGPPMKQFDWLVIGSLNQLNRVINDHLTHSSVVSMSRAVPSIMAQYAEANLVIS